MNGRAQTLRKAAFPSLLPRDVLSFITALTPRDAWLYLQENNIHIKLNENFSSFETKYNTVDTIVEKLSKSMCTYVHVERKVCALHRQFLQYIFYNVCTGMNMLVDCKEPIRYNL